MSDNSITGIVAELRGFFGSGATLAADFRLDALGALHGALQEYEQDILAALQADLGKSPAEGYLSELGLVLKEIGFARKHLRRWMRPSRARIPLFAQPAYGRVYYEPFGVTLNISPWNYPFQLALMPLVSAIAAGNCMALKPSSKAPHTAEMLKKLVTMALPSGLARVVTGPDAGPELLRERFDFILYTGSAGVGKTVMRAAAEHLTPVCLELGGKSPAMVFADANLAQAARSIAWGKLMNAGQTCIAPDYVLAHQSIKQELQALIQAEFERFPGPDALHNAQYGRIINGLALKRLLALSGGKAQADAQTLRMAPLLMPDASPQDPVMQEEIFGPLLPVLPFSTMDEALAFVRAREKPLACYIFTRDKRLARRVIDALPFGGGCVNDTLMHMSSAYLPFGGVGGSGMGRYHGEYGFKLLSNPKGVLHKRPWPDAPLRYPPYNEGRLRLIKRFLR